MTLFNGIPRADEVHHGMRVLVEGVGPGLLVNPFRAGFVPQGCFVGQWPLHFIEAFVLLEKNTANYAAHAARIDQQVRGTGEDFVNLLRREMWYGEWKYVEPVPPPKPRHRRGRRHRTRIERTLAWPS